MSQFFVGSGELLTDPQIITRPYVIYILYLA